MLWKGFQKPKRLEVNPDTLTKTYGEFYAQPYERGFATTVGNTLRRVLLSSIEGAAFTAMKIEGVVHEFSSVEGVTEDVTDIILNLKSVPLRFTDNETEQATVFLKAKGPGEVTAKDFDGQGLVEVLDPDMHIATLDKGATLEMELRVKLGRGYMPAESNFDEDLSLGYIPIDSIHSPVRKVNYGVSAARLGRSTDYEKLTLEVWTNGAVQPKEAVALASKLIKDHFYIFINFPEEPMEEDEEKKGEDDKLNEYLNRSIDELELSVRSYNCLKNANIRTIGELVGRTEQEMLKTKNFGRKSLQEIKEILGNMDLHFGMKLPDQQKSTEE
jgi:DNA-directed RNA polymerase subunit alpha